MISSLKKRHFFIIIILCIILTIFQIIILLYINNSLHLREKIDNILFTAEKNRASFLEDKNFSVVYLFFDEKDIMGSFLGCLISKEGKVLTIYEPFKKSKRKECNVFILNKNNQEMIIKYKLARIISQYELAIIEPQEQLKYPINNLEICFDMPFYPMQVTIFSKDFLNNEINDYKTKYYTYLFQSSIFSILKNYYLAIQGSIPSGFCGAPVVNQKGKLIGVVLRNIISKEENEIRNISFILAAPVYNIQLLKQISHK